jgi:Divergent InlB B-repeat domain
MRASILVVASILLVWSAGCRGLRIPDGKLRCGPHNECPTPYSCNTQKRCALKLDGGADVAVMGAPDSSVDVQDTPADGAGDTPVLDAPEDPQAQDTQEASAPEVRAQDAQDTRTQDEPVESPASPSYLLLVTIDGPSGTGSVVSTTTGVGIDCGGGLHCSALVPQGTSVELVASPSASGSFSSWSGCTSTSQAKCDVTVTATVTVTAKFKLRAGEACGQASDCSTGFCVSNVCCNTACTGACNASCQAKTGACIPQMARTPCGSKAGPGGPGGGTDVALICDGLGACVAPSIACTSESASGHCDLTSMVCCELAPTGSQRILACTTVAACATVDDGDYFYGFACSHAADCPLNQECCYGRVNIEDGRWARCLPSCDPTNDTTLP